MFLPNIVNNMNPCDKIERAIRLHEENLLVDNHVCEEDVRLAIRSVMRDNPDIFWFAHQYLFDSKEKTLLFQYQFSKERKELIQKSIDDVVENDFQIAYVRTLGVYEQIMFVYKWILTYCNYNVNSAYNQNIDSVFVRRNSVCTGYAKAAQYLFKLLNIESRLVFGRLNNDREDGRHCWNIVCIEGKFYHLDVCLGDLSLEDLLVKAGTPEVLKFGDFNYNCFCVSTEEIEKSRVIEDAESLPACCMCLEKEKIESLSRNPVKRRDSIVGCLLSPIGSSADIYLCSKDKDVVLKQFRQDSYVKYYEEYEYIKRLKGCKHLIQLNDKYTDFNNKIIAIEQSTPIVDLFCSHYYRPTLNSVLTMIMDVAKGWKECYERGIKYRDIHVCNIYKSNSGVYKLGDFGSCTDEAHRLTRLKLRERVGSQWFMSPETYVNCQFDERSAVYSITAVLYFILNGLQPPFVNSHNEAYALLEKLNGESLPVPVLLHSFPKDLAELIMDRIIVRGCAYYPSKRINSIEELLAEISFLYNLCKERIIEIRFNQPSPDSILNDTPLDIFIPRDVYHRFAYGEEIERIACTSNGSVMAIPEEAEMRCMPKKCAPGVIEDDSAETFEPSIKSYIKFGFSAIGSWFDSIERRNDVYSSIFAPAEVKRKTHMQVQVYLHRHAETEKVKSLAQESDKNAERRDYIPLQCKLKKNDKVDVLLNIFGETLLMSEKKSIIWQGSFTKCSFDFFVPKEIDVDELSCMALLSVNGIPVGEMRFITRIVESPRQLNPEIISHKYHKVFISYAHADVERVKSFHEGLKLAGIKHFFDRSYLKAGDYFPQVIQDYINSADLFVLFWSENASKSEYVEKERTLALQRAFPQVKPLQAAKLSIYPMSIEPRAELPSDMKSNYHFGEM